MNLRLLAISVVLLGLSATPAVGQQFLTNGSLETFTSGLPNGWTYTPEAGGPATIESTASLSPFTNVYPASTRSVLLTDLPVDSTDPTLTQTFAPQTIRLRLSFDFNLGSATLSHDPWFVALQSSQGSLPFNVFIDETSSGRIRVAGNTAFTATLTGNQWYQFRADYDPVGNTLSGSLTPFGGSSLPFSIATMGSTDINTLYIEDYVSTGAANTPIYLDNFSLTPVPEPTGLTAAAVCGLLAWRGLRRVRRRA